MLKILLLSIGIILVLLFIVPLFVAFFWGKVSPFENPASKAKTFGTGEPVYRYIVMGDSIGAGQGAAYEKGIAVGTAKHLGKKGSVAMQNFSVSGAKVSDVLSLQLPKALLTKPDVVLLSVGANDVIRLSSDESVSTEFETIIKKLIERNCRVKIIVTGTPDMGTVKRFLRPLAWVATWRSEQINDRMMRISEKYHVTQAPIFTKVGPIFRKDQSLFAMDNFHPNERGYAVWTSVLNAALDEALKNQPSHCK